MSMLSALVSLVAEGGAEVTNPLPMPAWLYGAIALSIFLILLFVLWCFRHTAQAAIDGPALPDRGDAHHGHAELNRPGSVPDGGTGR